MNKRTLIIKPGVLKKGPVIYWMSRDQRIHDNWALITAMNHAEEFKQPMVIVFNLVKSFLNSGSRQFKFMIKGLEEAYNTASEYNMPFFILKGDPDKSIPVFVKDISASALFTDFDPLSIKRKWLNNVSEKLNIPVYQTDSHNIVPAFEVSQKQEFSAAHFRRRITPLLLYYLEEYPPVKKMKRAGLLYDVPAFSNLLSEYTDAPFEVEWMKPGQSSAYKKLQDFLKKINNYRFKNDPNSNAVSDLSPYLHFGNISSQRIALNIEKINVDKEVRTSFLDELIVRKELSDNFCLYNKNYDSFEGFPQWGKETLNRHRKDEREFLYDVFQFEKAETHDRLWNAAQNELLSKGKMHGYLRMYWCKKILEWSRSPEEALTTAIYLNDKYELDGRDPNGYAGISWSMGGLHDRPFAERPVFGKIRYMNLNGCKRKFDVEKYIETMNSYDAKNCDR